jgi:hypothetical protein
MGSSTPWPRPIRCWADKGYQGAGGTVRVPYRGRWEKLSAGQKTVNVTHAEIRAVGEQAMAHPEVLAAAAQAPPQHHPRH